MRPAQGSRAFPRRVPHGRGPGEGLLILWDGDVECGTCRSHSSIAILLHRTSILLMTITPVSFKTRGVADPQESVVDDWT